MNVGVSTCTQVVQSALSLMCIMFEIHIIDIFDNKIDEIVFSVLYTVCTFDVVGNTTNRFPIRKLQLICGRMLSYVDTSFYALQRLHGK